MEGVELLCDGGRAVGPELLFFSFKKGFQQFIFTRVYLAVKGLILLVFRGVNVRNIYVFSIN